MGLAAVLVEKHLPEIGLEGRWKELVLLCRYRLGEEPVGMEHVTAIDNTGGEHWQVAECPERELPCRVVLAVVFLGIGQVDVGPQARKQRRRVLIVNRPVAFNGSCEAQWK
jgi:hypothetical protein